MQIEYAGPAQSIAPRQILTSPAADFFESAIRQVGCSRIERDGWTLQLGESLLFDSSGLKLLVNALRRYRGGANQIRFQLKLDPDAARDYYSLNVRGIGFQPVMASGHDRLEAYPTDDRLEAYPTDDRLLLPVTARRGATAAATQWETLDIEFDYCSKDVSYPRSLTNPITVRTPLALLMEYRGEFDILFANQIAVFADLAKRVRRSPTAWAKALWRRRRGSWARRASLACNHIHRTAEVHPTAVVEGSVVGPGAQVGAHCVVRYSHVGQDAQLLDGAKVECSVVGNGSWLMHDLVLFRSHVEDQVFLIHGPYQFSSFQSGSSAFATIMMDYRPDAEPIKAMTADGVQPYRGRFLGAVLKEGAKSLGGSLLAPGIVVPRETWLGCHLPSVHRPSRAQLPQRTVVDPQAPADANAGNAGNAVNRVDQNQNERVYKKAAVAAHLLNR